MNNNFLSSALIREYYFQVMNMKFGINLWTNIILKYYCPYLTKQCDITSKLNKEIIRSSHHSIIDSAQQENVSKTKGSKERPIKPLKFEDEKKYANVLKILTEKYFNIANTTQYSNMWNDLKNESFHKIERLNSHNFDGVMMTFLRKEKLFNQAESFFQHVQRNGKPNDAVLVNFMIAAADSGNEQTAIETYEMLNKSLFVVPEMQELVVEALTKTSLWKECLVILGQSSNIHVPAYLCTVSAAFDKKDFQVGVQLLKQIVNSSVSMTQAMYKSLLTTILSLSCPEEEDAIVTMILKNLQRNPKPLSIVNADILRQILIRRQAPTKVTDVTIKSTGQCSKCENSLGGQKLSAEEHTHLRELLLNYLKQGSASGKLSNPKELQAFLEFLKKAKPYDIVLDALNVAHCFISKPESYRQLANMLLDVVTALVGQGYRPLVLGKKFIWFWDKRIMTSVERQAKCFYADSISADDPFMMYAALHAGADTLIMTNDLLRDHKNLLPPESRKLFLTWRQSIQVVPVKNNGQIGVSHLVKYSPSAQGSWKNGWHVPYLRKEPGDVHLNKPKLHWLCIQQHQE